MNRFACFNRFTNSPLANYKGEIFSLPFNMYTFNKMWGVTTPQEAFEKIEQQKKAANVGFDWDNADQALYKLPEEVSELTKAMAEGSHAHIDEELGDVFFAAVNVARLLKRDPEQLLNAATDKFITRFKVMEELITADSLSLEDMTLEKMDRYWDKAKKKLK